MTKEKNETMEKVDTKPTLAGELYKVSSEGGQSYDSYFSYVIADDYLDALAKFLKINQDNDDISDCETTRIQIDIIDSECWI